MVEYQKFDFEESEPRSGNCDGRTQGDDMEGVLLRKRIYAKRLEYFRT